MDVSYVNPFIKATVLTFKTMINLDVVPVTPKIKEGNDMTYDVSGIIGLSGEAQGSIAISFPKLAALKIVSAILGIKIKIIGEDVTDGIGELANIVAGNAKQDLTKYKLTISLPNVIVGKNHYVKFHSCTKTIIVPFKCTLGDFAMEVSLKTN